MNTETLSTPKKFNGDKKHLIHFLAPYERIFLKAAVPWVPAHISTAHLTLMTLLWSAAIVAAGYLAQGNLQWLWLFNVGILMQYITDMLDGEVGRTRNSGLIKWGFYMDHFLDFVFLSSIVIGYSFLLPISYSLWVLLCLTCMAGYLVHAFLDFSITHNFKISCNLFGVSESRCVLIIFNIFLMIFGKTLLITIFPWVVMASAISLLALVYMSQKVYRHIDTVFQAQEDRFYH